MRSSSSSKRRCSAMPGTLPIQLANLTLDFLVDVQGGLSGRLAALVAGHDEGPDLVAQARIDDRPGQPLELVVDVQRRLSAPRAALVAGGQQLADLLVALAQSGGRRGRGTPRWDLVAHGERAPADVVVGLARDH